MNAVDIHRNRDPRQSPAYSLSEAARILRIPSPLLRSWIAGWAVPCGDGAAPPDALIHLPDPGQHTLSFENVVEAHVLCALRTEHGVDLRAVRLALAEVERELGIERPLLHPRLLADGGGRFIARFGALTNLSHADRAAVRTRLAAHLRRVERDPAGAPIRLYPFLCPENARRVVIDPARSFGHPILADSGLRTRVIAGRFRAGECVASLADDYEVTKEEIQTAVAFHQAAA